MGRRRRRSRESDAEVTHKTKKKKTAGRVKEKKRKRRREDLFDGGAEMKKKLFASASFFCSLCLLLSFVLFPFSALSVDLCFSTLCRSCTVQTERRFEFLSESVTSAHPKQVRTEDRQTERERTGERERDRAGGSGVRTLYIRTRPRTRVWVYPRVFVYGVDRHGDKRGVSGSPAV